MKGDIHSFNMRYSGMPCPKDLQRYGPGEGLCESSLVHCSSAPSALISSHPKAKKFLRVCLTIAASMVGSIGGSLGT